MLKCIILYMLCVFLAFPVVALKAQAKLPVKKAKITFELHRQYRTFRRSVNPGIRSCLLP